ncbi:hypothetical protein BLA13014_03832 [Burkholderia aenigmatica]|uniref:Uncharacterized protein n=1 Tax=Burkholderia aenigmatica TaxID=2015348 RepID=A0A6P2MCS4_9BURK|nr:MULTISPECIES: hypothetical protein [Burkholderia]VWB83105.1 hypothetical protein BLA13014_03832 [Burkholderia aenigmatica]
MKATVPIECPYCKHVSFYNLEDLSVQERGFYLNCGLDEGGCDRNFAARVKVQPVVRASAIEGE